MLPSYLPYEGMLGCSFEGGVDAECWIVNALIGRREQGVLRKIRQTSRKELLDT